MEVNRRAWDRMEFSRALRKVRKNMGITQAEMANRLGVARASLSLYEAGKQTPDLAFLDRLHKVTGAPLDYMMGYSDNFTPTTTVGKPTKRTTSTQSASSRPTAASLADISPTSTAGTRTRWKVWMPVDVSKSSTILRRHSTTSTKAKPRHPTSAQSSNTRRTAAGRR